MIVALSVVERRYQEGNIALITKMAGVEHNFDNLRGLLYIYISLYILYYYICIYINNIILVCLVHGVVGCSMSEAGLP